MTPSLAQQVPSIDQLERLGGLIGPVGVFALLALGLLFWRYSAEHLRKQHGLREAHERRDRREERVITALEGCAAATAADVVAKGQLATSINELGTSIRETERQRARDLSEILRGRGA